MPVYYDSGSDTLIITLAPEQHDPFVCKTGNYTAFIDDNDTLVKVTIANASRFVEQALASGVKVSNAPNIDPAQKGMVWYEADSSMISAFGYDEAEGVLEVAFNRTGVYQYFGVPVDVFEGLRDASSKGGYMRSYIIDMYHYVKK